MLDVTETNETLEFADSPEHESSVQQTTLSPRRRVFNLAGPMIGENFLETLLGIIDTILVAHLGATAIAGVGGALQVMFFLISALSALAIGSAVLVAQAFGAGDLMRASQLARQSLIWSVICSIPLAIGGYYLSAPIIGIFGVEPEVALIGTHYLQVTMGTIVVLIGLFIGGGVLRGAGDARTPLVVTAIANVINVGLAYSLINGHFGLPNMGAVGSAWATFIARAIALVLLVAALWQGRNGVSLKLGFSWRPQVNIARQIMRIGIPAAVEQTLVAGAFFALTVLVGELGTAVLAGHRIAFTALTFSFLPGIGFAMAATALVGQSIGAKRFEEGREMARISTFWATVWMTTIGAVFLLFAEPIMHIFVTEADAMRDEVISAGARGLRVVALAQPFWAILFVQSGALRGTGNTRFPLVITGVGMWVAILLAYLFVTFVSASLIAVWAAFLITSPIMAFLVWRRFRDTESPASEVPVVLH